MASDKILIPSAELIDVSKLKSDGKNPNRMTADQLEAVKLNIKRFGFLIPVITNKSYIIADGEHRVKAAVALGIKAIPVIKLDIEEVDRKILRQVMNKLHGTHDPVLDVLEFKDIDAMNGIDDMKELLAWDEREMLKVMSHVRNTPQINEKEFDSTLETDHEFPKCHFKF